MEYRVTIEPSGHSFSVREGEAVLEGALRAGLVIPYSCRGGSCSTCMGKVVEGDVHYPGGELPPALDPTEAAIGQALFCLARPAGDLVIEVREVRDAGDIEPRKLPCRVSRMERLAHDVMQLDLKLPDTERLQFLPGQYIDILLRDGRRRSYSLANPPHRDAFLELHVRHLPGGEFSGKVFGEMREKALLRMAGPFGTFFLREESERPILMMAGGTGLAPLQSILEHAFSIGIKRPIHLFWGVRARRDLYRHEQLLEWEAEHETFRYTPCLSEPLPGDDWEGRIGLVHNMLLQDYRDLSAFDVYASGPPGMIEAARRDFRQHGLDEGRFFFDSFEHAADAEPEETSD